MGTDNLYHKRKLPIEGRKRNIRTPKAKSFLIVSEGEKTEPIYFDGLAKHINDKYGKSIDVEKPIIKTCGEGKCTVSLVEEAAKIHADQSKILYNQVWVVFDKDDFKDFDEAVDLAKKHGFHVAWSNESFEYWLYLHFNYNDSALHRRQWVEKLDELFKAGITKGGYNKNDPHLFEIVTTHGNLKAAISNAYRIEDRYNEKSQKPSEQNPCTKVHHLVNELKEYLDDLLY